MSVPGDTVTLLDAEGNAHETPRADVAEALASKRFHRESDQEHVDRVGEARKQEQMGGAAGAVVSTGLGALRTVSLGTSDAALGAIYGQHGTDQIKDLKRINPGANLAGEIGGAFLDPVGVYGAARTLGAAAEGSSALRAVAGGAIGGAAEGAAFGAGQGVSELALSNDPLTAEHVASVLSSNVLLGGTVGGVAGGASKLFERGLQLAGDKLAAARATRGAVEGLPADLQGLDDAGLKQALADAKAGHAADIKAERASLEEVRGNQRAEMANQVRELHENLATERPIFHALSEADDIIPALKGIEGVSDARVQLAKSFRSLRGALDSPLSVERDPFPLIRPLEQRQAALETLQQKLPELHAALAGDTRAAVLEHVDAALADTKQQISSIRALRETPVSGHRLTALEAGPSARMEAIAAAREALKSGGELGMVGKGATGAAFGGVTALAHMIPGVGIAAPFLGKAAADAVGTLFKRGAGAVGTVAGKAEGAAAKFLGAAKGLDAYAAPTATKVLSAVRFGTSKAEPPADDLGALFRHATTELYGQTMRAPDGTTVMRPEARQAMAAKLDPIRHVNPILADKIETVQARKTAYLASVAPKKPDPPALQIGPDNSRPGDLAIRAWARVVRAVEDPSSVEERLARGVVTPEEAQAYRAVYPERFAELQREIFTAAPMLEKTLPMAKKVALSIFTGIPVTPAMQPNVLAVLQATFDVEPGSAGGTQAPRPQPSYGAMGSLKDVDKPTPAQAREGAGGQR